MSDFILSCCSMADLTNEYMNKIGVRYLGGHFSIDNTDYVDDMGKTISSDDLYEKMLNGSQVSTFLNNIAEFENYFENLLKEGKDILHVCFSASFSGIFESAKKARDNVIKKHPDSKIYIVDSVAASTGYGFLMDKAAELRASGKDIDYVYSWLEENKLKMYLLFFSHDLSFYIKGGRMSKLAGTFGKMLGICPVLHMNRNGQLVPFLKVRSKEKAINALVDNMVQKAENGTDYSGRCFLTHSDSYDEVMCLRDKIKEKFKNIQGDIEIFNIGPVIGCHTGPGTVAVFFWGIEERGL